MAFLNFGSRTDAKDQAPISTQRAWHSSTAGPFEVMPRTAAKVEKLPRAGCRGNAGLYRLTSPDTPFEDMLATRAAADGGSFPVMRIFRHASFRCSDAGNMVRAIARKRA